jgi:hypothetical protein
MGKIFISYRRDDSEYIVGRIYEDLCTAYGEKNIFKDVDSIPLGVDFRDEISEVVNSCDMLIALIGEKWNTISDESGNPRINNPDDLVRIEIEEALKRNIPVIPIITSKAEIPKENELPDSLKELAYRNAIRIRPDPDYKTDIVRLKNNIDETYKKQVNFIPYFTILAIIGLIGILGGSFFVNWDNVFPPHSSVEKNNNGITPISKKIVQEVGGNAVEKKTWVCSDSIVGEYIEIDPKDDSTPVKMIFHDNGEGAFQYEEEAGIHKERLLWKKQKKNEFLLAFIKENDEITSTELYTCVDNVLSITVDGKTYKHRLIK